VRCDLLSFCRAKEKRGKGRRWVPYVVVASELVQSARGFGRGCAVAAMMVGPVHAPLPGIG